MIPADLATPRVRREASGVDMEESFEHCPLLDRDTLRNLQQRQDTPSLIHMTLHLGAFAAAVAFVIFVSPFPLLAIPASVMLGAVWATLFAPFHECTHQTAFRSRRLNAISAWLTGVPFGMAPAVYRDFHFMHHRCTHDPARDPEILGAPTVAVWPTAPLAWIWMIAGLWFVWLKVGPMFRVSFSPAARSDLAPRWAEPDHWASIVWQTRVVTLIWVGLLAMAVMGVRSVGWLLLALLLSHFFQAVWLTAEHTGLPHHGTILARTRTAQTAPFISWWLWNMNYHAEHHAWPAVPWHALPSVHRLVVEYVEHQSPGYWKLQFAVLKHANLPDGVPTVAGS